MRGEQETRSYHRVVMQSSIYFVVLIFLARFFRVHGRYHPPPNTVLSPDCDEKRGDHFILFIAGAGCPPSTAGVAGAIGFPTIVPLPSTIFALIEPKKVMQSGVLTC